MPTDERLENLIARAKKAQEDFEYTIKDVIDKLDQEELNDFRKSLDLQIKNLEELKNKDQITNLDNEAIIVEDIVGIIKNIINVKKVRDESTKKLLELTKKLNILNNSCDGLTATIADKDNKIDETTAKEINTKLADLQNQIKATETEIAALNKKIEDFEIQLLPKGIDDASSSLYKVEFDKLEQEIKKSTDELEKLQVSLTAALPLENPFKKRIYSENPTLEQLASKEYLSSEERFHVKHMFESFPDMIEYIEKNYKYAKYARNNDELKKMRAKCIDMLEVLDAYKTYLISNNKYEGSKKEIIDKCFKKLLDPVGTVKKEAGKEDVIVKGLLVDDDQLGPNAKVFDEVSSISTDVLVVTNEHTRAEIDKWLADRNIGIGNTKVDDALKISVNAKNQDGYSTDKANYTSRYTHMVTGKDSNKTHYVTHQTEENGQRIARFLMDNTNKETAKKRNTVTRFGVEDKHLYVKSGDVPTIDVTIPMLAKITIPNDDILAWAITQVEDFLHDNTESQNVMRLTGNLGDFTEDHVEAIMLYAAYKREIEGSGLYIHNETGVNKPIRTDQIYGLFDRLKDADMGPKSTSPFKDAKVVIDRIKSLPPGYDTPRQLMQRTGTPVRPVTHTSKPS